MKKKLIAGALCALLACGVLVGCSGQSGGSQEGSNISTQEYVAGTRTKTAFTSEWIGLTYTLADDMTMVSDDEITEMMEASQDILYKNKADGQKVLDAAKMKLVYEVVASNLDGSSNIVLMTEKLNTSSIDEKQYITAAKQQIKAAMNADFNFKNTSTRTIAGQEFMELPYTATVNNGGTKVTINQSFLLRKQGDRMICMTLTYPNQAEYERLLAGFSKV